MSRLSPAGEAHLAYTERALSDDHRQHRDVGSPATDASMAPSEARRAEFASLPNTTARADAGWANRR